MKHNNTINIYYTPADSISNDDIKYVLHNDCTMLINRCKELEQKLKQKDAQIKKLNDTINELQSKNKWLKYLIDTHE